MKEEKSPRENHVIQFAGVFLDVQISRRLLAVGSERRSVDGPSLFASLLLQSLAAVVWSAFMTTRLFGSRNDVVHLRVTDAAAEAAA